ncbi:MAG: lipid II flippase MurJ [Micrococcales bacterium]|nr:MAG: lipid II flippase MurJ [Micrococcales bacterium]
MAAGTVTSRALGFVRLLVLNIALGAYFDSANTFALANTVPNMIYMLVAGGVLNAVLVPQIVRASRHPDGGQAYVNRLITWSLLLLAAIAFVATAAAPLIVRLYSDNDNGAWLALATAFAFWCLPQVFFYGMYTVLGQILNAHGRFGAFMWAPVLNNVVGVAGLGLFIWLYGPAGKPDAHPVSSWNAQMIAVLAGTATLGVVAQAVVLIRPLRRTGLRYRPDFRLRGTGLGRASRVALWTFAALVVTQIALWVSTRVATSVTAPAGESVPGLQVMQNALLLFMLPHSVVTVSLVTALFTAISRAAGRGDLARVVDQLSFGLRTVGLFTVLGTAGLVGLAWPAAKVFTGAAEADGLAWVIIARSLGLVFFSATYLFQRLSYAYEDARTPFWVQMPGVILIMSGSLAAGRLPPQWVVAGVSLAWTAGAVSNALLSPVVLRGQFGSLGLRRVLGSHLRMLVAGAVAAAAGLVTSTILMAMLPGRAGAVLVCAMAGIVIVAVYAATCWVVRVPELTDAVQVLRRRIRR